MFRVQFCGVLSGPLPVLLRLVGLLGKYVLEVQINPESSLAAEEAEAQRDAIWVRSGGGGGGCVLVGRTEPGLICLQVVDYTGPNIRNLLELLGLGLRGLERPDEIHPQMRHSHTRVRVRSHRLHTNHSELLRRVLIHARYREPVPECPEHLNSSNELRDQLLVQLLFQNATVQQLEELGGILGTELLRRHAVPFRFLWPDLGRGRRRVRLGVLREHDVRAVAQNQLSQRFLRRLALCLFLWLRTRNTSLLAVSLASP